MVPKIRANLFLAVIPALLLLNSCQDRYLQTFEVSNPVYLSYEDLRAPVSDTTPVELNQPGKIYLLEDYIFVNEIFTFLWICFSIVGQLYLY